MVELVKQENLAGDPDVAAQGFGRVAAARPPAFDPAAERQAARDFFEGNGFVVLKDCLTAKELAHLNGFFARTQAERPASW